MKFKLLILTLVALGLTTIAYSQDLPKGEWIDLTPCEEIGNNNSICQGTETRKKETLFSIIKEKMGYTQKEEAVEPKIVTRGKSILVPNPRYIQTEDGKEQLCIPIETAVIGEYTWECK